MEQIRVKNSAQNMSNDVEECPVGKVNYTIFRMGNENRKVYVVLIMCKNIKIFFHQKKQKYLKNAENPKRSEPTELPTETNVKKISW